VKILRILYDCKSSWYRYTSCSLHFFYKYYLKLLDLKVLLLQVLNGIPVRICHTFCGRLEKSKLSASCFEEAYLKNLNFVEASVEVFVDFLFALVTYGKVRLVRLVFGRSTSKRMSSICGALKSEPRFPPIFPGFNTGAVALSKRAGGAGILEGDELLST
jgi:hypothetical protein